MSFALFGNAVSPGISIGRAQLVSHATLEVVPECRDRHPEGVGGRQQRVSVCVDEDHGETLAR